MTHVSHCRGQGPELPHGEDRFRAKGQPRATTEGDSVLAPGIAEVHGQLGGEGRPCSWLLPSAYWEGSRAFSAKAGVSLGILGMTPLCLEWKGKRKSQIVVHVLNVALGMGQTVSMPMCSSWLDWMGAPCKDPRAEWHRATWASCSLESLNPGSGVHFNRMFMLQLSPWFAQNLLKMGSGIPRTCGIHPTIFPSNCEVVIHFLVWFTLGMHGKLEGRPLHFT